MTKPDAKRESKALRLAVFDCDGTLVDSQHSLFAAMRAAFEKHGLTVPERDAVRRIVGLPLEEGVSRLFPDPGAEDPVKVAESYKDAFGELRRKGKVQEPLYPGALEALQALEEDGWLLGVATGKSHRGLMATIDGLELTDRFVTLQTADLARGKPDPDMLLRAMAETGAEARHTVMIGDTTFDVEMACNAGTMAVGVSWGYHDPEQLRAMGTQIIINAFDELPGAMRILMGGEG